MLPPGERVYAVGDIHGRADLAAEMQELICAHAARTSRAGVTVVWLGDYVDRGPSTCEVIDLLLGFAAKHPRSIFLLGNHEEALLSFLVDPNDGVHWFRLGGLETLASYGIDIEAFHFGLSPEDIRDTFLAALPERHREFLLSLKLSMSIGDFFFCHAGVRPGVDLEAQAPHDLIWIRDEFLNSRNDFGKVIVHGHTPVAEPELRPNRVNVDTGAFATGRLTCAVIEGSDISFLSTRTQARPSRLSGA
ncbi:MAG: serine/threonine protein phosphatase [Hyphomicrobiales bacterium]|nr:serine/threonine protein phosphatase [Hyphomicrobiales bacterium]